MVNGTEESKFSKTRHIRVQPILGGKIEDIQQNLKDLYMKIWKHLLSMPVPTMQQSIFHK